MFNGKMRIKKNVINIDKLRISFRQPQDLWEKLKENSIKKDNDGKPIHKYINYDGFSLHIIDDGRGKNNEKEPVKIVAQVILCDNTLLGDFVFNNSAKYDGLCFFTFANSALYTCNTIVNGIKTNYIHYISFVADTLNLAINTFTEIELSVDVNFNPTPIIRKMVKDYVNFDMIVNRKKVENENRKIENYGEWFCRSRKRLERYPTIYIRQANEEGQKLKIYNKTQEINEESGKDYITKWNDFGCADIHRIEVSVKWENFKKWLDYLQDNNAPDEWRRHPTETPQEYLEKTLSLLTLNDYKASMWCFCAEKMLYFRHRAKKAIVSMADIANGYELPTERKNSGKV